MKSILSKFQKVKAQGFFRTLEVQFNQFVPPWVFRYSMGDIYDLDIDALQSLPLKGDGEDLILRCLEPSSDEAARLALREFTWNSVLLETTSNDLGYAVYDANQPDKLLAGVWIAKDSFLEDNLGIRFNFTQQQSWLYCAYVHADARGRGVYKRLISFAAADLHERGCQQLIAIVQPWNRISRLMHEKHSRGIVGRVGATRVGSLIHVSHSGNIEVDRTFVTNPTKAPAEITISSQCCRPILSAQKPATQTAVVGRQQIAKPM